MQFGHLLDALARSACVDDHPVQFGHLLDALARSACVDNLQVLGISRLCISSLCICTAPRAACVQEAFKERAASIVDAEPELQAATFDHKPGVNANTEYRELLERVWKKCDPARAPMQSNAQSHNSFPNDEVA